MAFDLDLDGPHQTIKKSMEHKKTFPFLPVNNWELTAAQFTFLSSFQHPPSVFLPRMPSQLFFWIALISIHKFTSKSIQLQLATLLEVFPFQYLHQHSIYIHFFCNYGCVCVSIYSFVSFSLFAWEWICVNEVYVPWLAALTRSALKGGEEREILHHHQRQNITRKISF